MTGRAYARHQEARRKAQVKRMVRESWDSTFYAGLLNDAAWLAARASVRGTCNRRCGCKPWRKLDGPPIAELRQEDVA